MDLEKETELIDRAIRQLDATTHCPKWIANAILIGRPVLIELAADDENLRRDPPEFFYPH